MPAFISEEINAFGVLSPDRTMSADPIDTLIKALDTEDVRRQREAGNALSNMGAGALPALRQALFSESAQVRKAVAFLLRRQRLSADAVEDLCRVLLTDQEPKVRKNAAVTLGKAGRSDSVEALLQALGQEGVPWVRPSLILALGAVGGPAAHAALRAMAPTTAAEEEALRKALDRLASHDRRVDWSYDADWPGTVVLDVPPGLEEVALEEAAAHGIGSVRRESPGRLRCPETTAPWGSGALRCVYGVLIQAGRIPLSTLGQPSEWGKTLGAFLADSPSIRGIHRLLNVPDGTVQYRFSMEDRRGENQRLRKGLLKGMKKRLLNEVRKACRPLGWVDSPSTYDIELKVSIEERAADVFIKPSFVNDTRFAYRHKDVGAAMNPVVAACLARLVRTPHARTVFDPTCGSGTLLIERALIGTNGLALKGLDISKTAIQAARTNIAAAGRARQITVETGHAAQEKSWPVCDEVIANLPFGLRTSSSKMDLEGLYHAILTNLALRLQPQGRALFYTGNKKLFEKVLSKHKHTFRTARRLRVLSGGLWVHIWMLRPTHRRAR